MFLKQSIQRLIATAILSAATVVLAQSGGGYDLTWSTIDGGGVMNSTGGTFTLAGTIGQPDAASNPTLTGGAFELTGGFWPVANVCYCLGDLNADGKKNGADVQKFIGCILAGGKRAHAGRCHRIRKRIARGSELSVDRQGVTADGDDDFHGEG
jgi:hypothetical protein